MDFTSFPQLHSGFSLSWKVISNRLRQLLTEFGDGRMNLGILLLKNLKAVRFSKHLIAFDGKKQFLNKLGFVFRRRMLCIFRVKFNECLGRIRSKRYLGFLFPKTF